MKAEFLTYEQSLALKELGFNEPCFGEYRQWDGSRPYLQLYQHLDSCSTDPADYEYTVEVVAPLKSQVFRWLYQKLGIDKGIMPLDEESQNILLKELIDKVSSKHL